MSEEKEDVLISLSFSGKILRAVEGQKQGEEVRLVSVAEHVLDIPFDYAAVSNEDYIPKFATSINSMLEETRMQSQSALFALERRMVLLKKVRVDAGMNETELRQQLEWELEQILISSRDEYNVAYERLLSLDDPFEDIVLVAVRKHIINYLQEIFSRTSLKLLLVDVDLFAALRSFYKNFPSMGNNVQFMVDFSQRGIDFCLAKNGVYVNSSEISSSSFVDAGLNPYEGTNSEIAKLVKDEITRMLKVTFRENRPEISHIFLYGDRIDHDLQEQIQISQEQAKVAIANPFQNIHMDFDSQSDILKNEKPEKFVANVGLIIN